MPFRIEYQEVPGEPTPLWYLRGIPPEEHAAIKLKLDLLASTPIPGWSSFKWFSSVEAKIREVRQGDHRVLLCLHPAVIVVLHAFRKQGRKLKRKDIDLAIARRNRYLEDSAKKAS